MAMSIREAFAQSPQPCLKHSTYFDTYEALFAGFQNKPITFVEVGVLNGGSLFMWRQFFGPQARIIGIDLNPGAKKWIEHGFEIYVGSQSDPTFWDGIKASVGSIDILLDDGGHTYPQQIVTTELMLDSIVDDGLLVVEDTHTSYMEGFGDRRMSFINYAKVWVDKINSRFGRFHRAKQQSDSRVWSVEFFESIVAFKIRRSSSGMESQLVANMTVESGEGAKDFRHDDEAESDEAKRQINDIVKRGFSVYG